MSDEKFRNAQAIAAIFAAIAVPIVVAVVGWQIQKSISYESVRKDYVQMAIGILSRPETPEDAAIRKWAVAVLDKNSPVPFTSEVRSDLATGVAVIQPNLLRPILATSMMAPAQSWVNPPQDPTFDELIDNYEENMERAQHNYFGLKYLQKAVRVGAGTENAGQQDKPSPTTKND